MRIEPANLIKEYRMKIGLDSAAIAAHKHPNDFDQFDQWNDQIIAKYNTVTTPLFVVSLEHNELFEEYIASLPYHEQQPHNCNCCKDFLNRFGGLVTIDNGTIKSALFDVDKTPDLYKDAVRNMIQHIEQSFITHQFITDESRMGVKEQGGFTHFYAPTLMIHRNTRRDMTAGQLQALSKENFKCLDRAITEFTSVHVNTALKILESDTLWQSERFIPQVEWLQQLHFDLRRVKKDQRKNVIWNAVGSAPQGWCTPRSSVIGSLIEDIIDNKPFNTIKSNFETRVNPINYKRPTSGPKDQQVLRAEKYFDEHGYNRSIKRRYATHLEIPSEVKLFASKQPQSNETSTFGHLKSKPVVNRTRLPMAKMTAVKFIRDILPNLDKILFNTVHSSYFAMTTAVDITAPCILKWDNDNRRNPFSWYQYYNGSSPLNWNLQNRKLHEVQVITNSPESWFTMDITKLCFFIESASDRNNPSSALFPDTLKAEFHQYRNTIENHSKMTKLGVVNNPACGVMISKSNQPYNFVYQLECHYHNFIQDIVIDRWE